MKPPRILFSAGEVSGDAAAAWLARTILASCPEAELFGVGGRQMAEAGVNVLMHTCHLGSVGLTEPMSTVPGLFSSFLTLRRAVREKKPQLAVLVGHEIFNWILALYLALKKVRTVCLFPPQIWIWKSLLRVIAPAYTVILSSFPEEHELYRQSGGRSHFVGHYLCDQLEPRQTSVMISARRTLEHTGDGPLVALLPGSRNHEIRQLTPILLGVAHRLAQLDQRIRFVMPVADRLYAGVLKRRVTEAGLEELVRLTDDSRTAMQAADLAVMASGTASLEAALIGVPMVIVYRISKASLLVVRIAGLFGLLSDQFVGLPNLLRGCQVVPELHQHRASVDEVARKSWEILSDSRVREQVRAGLSLVRAALTGGLRSESASELVLQLVQGGSLQGQPRNC